MPQNWTSWTMLQGLGPLGAGFLAFLGARAGARSVKASSDKTIFVQTVTTERAVWRKEMRELVVELTSEVRRGAVSPAKPVNWKKVYAARVGIVVRLNPICRQAGPVPEQHADDKLLFDAVLALSNARYASNPDWMAKADAVEEASQRVLKREWDKSIDEARTGMIKNPTSN